MRIFKYVSMEAAKLILESRTLRCAAPATFNDPFELQVFPKARGIDKEEFIAALVRQFHELQAAGDRVALDEVHIKTPIELLVALYQAGELDAKDDEAFSAYLGQWLRERTIRDGPSAWTRLVHQRIARTVHICCFSTNKCSLLMWAHYADHHKGVVLEFEADVPASFLSGIREVRYVNDFPNADDLEETAARNLGRMSSPIREQEILDQMLYMKSTEWSYEREWRVIAGAPFKSDSFESFVPFPATALKAVHLGCRSDREAGWELSLIAKAMNTELEVHSRSVDPSGFRLLSELVVAGDELLTADPGQ